MTALTSGGDATDDADGDLTGTTFAGREVESVLARDLVSTVYRATHPDDDRAVALRVVAADLCGGDGDDRRLYDQFHRYAGAALTLQHPNVPTVEEVGEHQGRGYVVTAAVDSMPFAAYIEQHGPLGLARALPLFEQVADVLDAGQRVGVTHGAVNPLTLRIATPLRDGDVPAVYLTGHGLGALLGLRLRRDRRDLQVVDDLLYVAPEQLRAQTSTGRTDQYAMTCALVHALTGSPPFVRDSVNGLFGAHLFVEPGYDPHLSSSSAIHKGLSKRPRDRYATCGQLIADIERAQRSAANRRRAATRRRLTAVRQRPAPVGVSTRPAPAVLYERSDVRHAGTRPDDTATAPATPTSDAATPGDAATVTPTSDAATPGDAATVTPTSDAATPERGDDLSVGPPTAAVDGSADDKSSTAVHDGSDLAYASTTQELAVGSDTVEPEVDPAGVPSLSEVLSRRRQRPRQVMLGRVGTLLALVVVALIAVAAVLWLTGS